MGYVLFLQKVKLSWSTGGVMLSWSTGGVMLGFRVSGEPGRYGLPLTNLLLLESPTRLQRL